MRILFMLLIGILAASDILQADMSLGPGLSAKNALLYPIAIGLLFRLAITGRFRVRLPIVNASFIIWVVYALLTWVVCITVIHYPGYQAMAAAISLKSVLIDSALFFFTYFYGVESEEDYLVLAKTLAFCIAIANILTLADVAGIVHLGITIGQNGVEEDRVFGVFGHANDTAALIDCLLPLLVAVAISSRGAAKVFWYAGTFASVAVLILTVSRGGYVGLIVGYAWAVWMGRKYLPTSRVLAWTLIGASGVVVAAIVAVLLMPQIAQVLSDRLFNQSMAVSISVASSGRTTIWLGALEAMMAHPLTFLTGFGWDVYRTRFVLVTHNYYLDQWFALGAVGLLCFLTILYQTIRTTRRAVALARPAMRPYMLAFMFGLPALAVCIFFINLNKPWSYVWIYIGFSLRTAVDIVAAGERSAAGRAAATASPQPVLPTGWTRGAPAQPRVGELRR